MRCRYLLEKIAARIQGEGLEETITGMIEREKRPYMCFDCRGRASLLLKRSFWLLGGSPLQIR